MKKHTIIIFFCLLSLVSCNENSKYVGTWQRIGKETLILNKDRTFQSKYNFTDYIMQGVWEIKGDSLIITPESGGLGNEVRYRVVEINSSEMIIQTKVLDENIDYTYYKCD